MTPVVQSKVVGRDGYGTCWSACLASLLDLPEAAVPHFADPARFTTEPGDDLSAYACGRRPLNWWWAAMGWLRMLGYTLDDVHPGGIVIIEDDYLIASGLSPRSPGPDGKEITHAVVYGRQPDGSYALVHDPYPGGGGLVGEPRGFRALRPLSPTAP